MRRFFVYSNEYKDINLALANRIKSYIEKKGGQCMVGAIGSFKNQPEQCFSDIVSPDTELIFVIGGDGSLIRVASATEMKGIPLIGVNLGTLGYMCELEESSLESAIDLIMEDEYEIESRMRLISGDNTALNDVVIHRPTDQSVIKLTISVNGLFLQTIEGDGVIVSTPTGSTGYNMSAGGPIVDPKARMMLITPINCHSMYSRSIVLGADDEVAIDMCSRSSLGSEEAAVSFDGVEKLSLFPGDRLMVKASDRDFKMLKLSKLSFLEILRKKFS